MEYNILVSTYSSTSDGSLMLDRLNIGNLMIIDPKVRSDIMKLQCYDLVPFSYKSIYESFCKLNNLRFYWLNFGLIIYGLPQNLKPAFAEGDFIISISCSKDYIPNGKHIGLEYTNKKTQEYIMLDQRYYYVKRIDYMDLCDPGITLPEKCFWLRIKFRKRYAMLITHLMVIKELPNFKEIMLSWIHTCEFCTKLELGFQELAILGLLPQQTFAELALIPNFNMSVPSLIIAESLGYSPSLFRDFILRPPKEVHYTDMIGFGTTFSKNFDQITQYIINCAENLQIGWNEFPINYIDSVCNTYIPNNDQNRIKSELEKLILWKIHGFNTKFFKWIRICDFNFIELEVNFQWSPPFTIYRYKDINPQGKTVELYDNISGYTIVDKEHRQFHYLNLNLNK